ncbi:ABC transporter permease [Dorea sp. D27]|uniref:ABC transporter permease n=1 Tax=Dorea sp. D27 TaxID=658665 RepID=UPI0006737651|nr:ABC transporter permease [Dorea sp. D27]KMZ55571.1 ABC-2 type transporter superfamily [Dorea sp. D27]
MRGKRIYAVWKKQMKDTLKNKAVLIQFVMFPVLSVIMQNSIKIEGMSGRYFVILFATMYVGMAPLTAVASIISEEKEKNTLRELLMANVKAAEYLLGIGLGIFVCCMLGAVVFALAGQYTGRDMADFLLVMAAGIVISLLLGAVIGISCRNQVTEVSVSVPVMLVFSFLPMLASFNEKIAAVSKYAFSQQISNYMSAVGDSAAKDGNLVVILCNAGIFAVLFGVVYRKCRLI